MGTSFLVEPKLGFHSVSMFGAWPSHCDKLSFWERDKHARSKAIFGRRKRLGPGLEFWLNEFLYMDCQYPCREPLCFFYRAHLNPSQRPYTYPAYLVCMGYVKYFMAHRNQVTLLLLFISRSLQLP